jgi:hypothetical protein
MTDVFSPELIDFTIADGMAMVLLGIVIFLIFKLRLYK